MINKIIASNFKLFQHNTEFQLSNVNLLTGINGHGKSSFLQILLLLKQTINSNSTSSKLLFNGDYVELGTFKDVKHYNNSQSEPIVLQFYSDDNFTLHYLLSENEDDDICADITACHFTDKGKIISPIHTKEKSPCLFENLIPNRQINNTDYEYSEVIKNQISSKFNFRGIHYISADRIGPKLFYSQQSIDGFSSVGHKGEYTVNAIHKFKDQLLEQEFIDAIIDEFEIEEATLGKTVEFQTEFWLSQIFGKTKLKTQYVQEANVLTLALANDDKISSYFKPTNVGYGFTYALPIIVASLIAKKGEIIIIENPEAHLHPYAQSMIAKLLSLLKYRGVQVFIESHSDHILNGLRISVMDKIITKDDLSILYFDKSYSGHCKKIEVDNNGQISDWPQGFFDQAANDLNKLFGVI